MTVPKELTSKTHVNNIKRWFSIFRIIKFFVDNLKNGLLQAEFVLFSHNFLIGKC